MPGSRVPGWIARPTARIRCAGRVQVLLGHTKLESTVRYLGIEVDDALASRELSQSIFTLALAENGWLAHA